MVEVKCCRSLPLEHLILFGCVKSYYCFVITAPCTSSNACNCFVRVMPLRRTVAVSIHIYTHTLVWLCVWFTCVPPHCVDMHVSCVHIASNGYIRSIILHRYGTLLKKSVHTTVAFDWNEPDYCDFPINRLPLTNRLIEIICSTKISANARNTCARW